MHTHRSDEADAGKKPAPTSQKKNYGPWARDVAHEKRPPFFALALLRLLLDSDEGQRIGPAGIVLVMQVASKEDSLRDRYSRPVDFFQSQLIGALGIKKWETFDRLRNLCVQEGWLNYQPPPNGSRLPGRYFTTIPDELAEAYPLNGYGEQKPSPPNGDGSGYGRGDGQAEAYPPSGDGMGYSPYPKPQQPKPIPEECAQRTVHAGKFVPPTVDQVKAYCLERKNSIDPEAFVAYYEAQDWKLSNGLKMKKWQSAIITWEKNGKEKNGYRASRRPETSRRSAAYVADPSVQIGTGF